MRNRIRHNYPSLIQCLRAFHILIFAYLLFCCHRYRYFHTTLLLNTLLQILSYPGVVELTTQLLILKNILWLRLCRINKFGLNTLPSKAVVIPYTCEVENHRNKKIEFLRSDHGGEYLSYEFGLHLKQCGIVSQLTPPGTPHNPISTAATFCTCEILITHKYRGSQQFSRVEYSTQICWFDTRGAKEYSQVLVVELSIQPHLDNLISAAKYLVTK